MNFMNVHVHKFADPSTIYEQFTEEQQKMLLKQQSPQDTLDRLADFLNTAHRKYVDKNGPDVPRPPKQA